MAISYSAFKQFLKYSDIVPVAFMALASSIGIGLIMGITPSIEQVYQRSKMFESAIEQALQQPSTRLNKVIDITSRDLQVPPPAIRENVDIDGDGIPDGRIEIYPFEIEINPDYARQKRS